MTDAQPCITHELDRLPRADRPRACMRKGQHYAACEDDGCRGCVPRTATHGLLCDVCWEIAQDAIARVGDLIAHLRSINNGGQAIGERVDTSKTKRLPLYESWLAADEMLDALGARPMPSTVKIWELSWIVADALAPWHDLEARVQTIAGASGAVILARRMQVALRRWPGAEAHFRPIPELLCPSCRQRTLWRRGPLEFGDDLRAECRGSNLMYEQGIGYDHCEFRQDWFEFSAIYAPIFEWVLKKRDQDERAERKRARKAQLAEAFGGDETKEIA